MRLIKLNMGDVFLRRGDHESYTFHGLGYRDRSDSMVAIATDEQGMIIYIRPGEEVTLAQPESPNGKAAQRR